MSWNAVIGYVCAIGVIAACIVGFAIDDTRNVITNLAYGAGIVLGVAALVSAYRVDRAEHARGPRRMR